MFYSQFDSSSFLDDNDMESNDVVRVGGERCQSNDDGKAPINSIGTRL